MATTIYDSQDLPAKVAKHVVVDSTGSVSFLPPARFATFDGNEPLTRRVTYAIGERIPRSIVDGIGILEPLPNGPLWLAGAERLVLLDAAGNTVILAFYGSEQSGRWTVYTRSPLCVAMRTLFQNQ